jgi:hypothetical protein
MVPESFSARANGDLMNSFSLRHSTVLDDDELKSVLVVLGDKRPRLHRSAPVPHGLYTTDGTTEGNVFIEPHLFTTPIISDDLIHFIMGPRA